VQGVAFTLLLGFAPAPSEVVDAVQEIEVETSTEVASVFRLRLGIAQTPTGDWSLLEKDIFQPLTPIAIRVGNGAGVPEALMNGYVTSQQVSYANQPGDSVLEVTGMDATLLMNLQEKVMPWPNLPDNLIATAIFGQYTLIPRVQPTPPLLVEPEGTTTQRSTDIRFLRRLAERNGFECYVQPEPLSGLDIGFFQPPQLTGLPQAVLNVNLGTETNVLDFKVSYQMSAPTTAVAAGVDFTDKSVQVALAPASTQVPLGLEPTLLRITPPPVVRLADTGLMRSSELQTLAQSVADRSSFAVAAEGNVDQKAGILRPGGLVNVRGAGRSLSGSYYVTRVTHTINREGYTQRFSARRNAVQLTGAEVFVQL
jgi:Phage tail baseplate hub (GPD)